MPLLLILLSLIDIFSGLAIIFQLKFFFWIFYLALFCLFKGFWTLSSSLGFGFDLGGMFMGVIDLLAGVSLLLISKNIFFNFFQIAGILMTIKGFYSLALSL